MNSFFQGLLIGGLITLSGIGLHHWHEAEMLNLCIQAKLADVDAVPCREIVK